MWSAPRVGFRPNSFHHIYVGSWQDHHSRHGLQYHMHADDCQIYTIFSSVDSNGTDCVTNMVALICDIRGWYADNKLKLNDDKTEIIII